MKKCVGNVVLLRLVLHFCIFVCLSFTGLLSATDSLTLTVQASTISLTWIPPFTLDITFVTPDIEGYCVSVDVITTKSASTLIYSECVNVTEFSYPLPPDTGCHTYSFNVTPVNIAGNGTSATVSYSPTESKFSSHPCRYKLISILVPNFVEAIPVSVSKSSSASDIGNSVMNYSITMVSL